MTAPQSGRQRAALGAGLIAGALLATAVAVWAWRYLDDTPDGLNWGWLALLGGVALITISVIAWELRVLASFLGVPIKVASSIRITVIGSLANLLPLPGSTITRLVALNRAGSTTGAATKALIGGGITWLGASFVVVGVALVSERPAIGALFAAAGLVGLGTAFIALRSIGATPLGVAQLIGVELALTATAIARFWIALRVLGLDGTVREVAALSAAGPAATAVAFIPAGLGIREGIAAALGSLSGLGGAEAGLSATLDRAVGLSVLVIPYLIASRRPANDPVDPADDSADE